MEGLKIVVVGATGTIGKDICSALMHKGYKVIIFSRNIVKAKEIIVNAFAYVDWQGEEYGQWSSWIDGAYAVLNLSGASIAGKRWNSQYLQIIKDSRIIGTRGIVNAINDAMIKPKVLINASSIGYYGFNNVTSEFITEDSPHDGGTWLLDKDWENEAMKAKELGIRVITMRTSFVLDKSPNGALSKLLKPYKLFVGGPFMPLDFYRPWIHIDDEVGLWLFALENEKVNGGLNCTAPTPLTNKEFAKVIGKVLNRPSVIPIPSLILKIVVGDVSLILTQVKRLIPKKALDLGYKFKFSNLEEALKDVLSRT